MIEIGGQIRCFYLKLIGGQHVAHPTLHGECYD